MKFNLSNRQFLSAAIIVFYLIPLLFFSSYSIHLMSHNKSWSLLSLGLLLVFFGSLSLIYLLLYWEQSLRDKRSPHPLLSPSSSFNDKDTKVTLLDPSLTFASNDALEYETSKESAKELNLLQTAMSTNQEQQEQLLKALELKNQELHQQEEDKQQLQLKAQHIAQDFADYKLFSEEQLKQKQLQMSALQQIIEDQKAEMEKRQEQIHQLDSKIHDLSYEIKTLLYLHEEEAAPPKSSRIVKEEIFCSSNELQTKHETNIAVEEMPSDQENTSQNSFIHTPVEAAVLLKKCLNIAQKLTGTHYYSNESSRYREFSSSYFAIDQRRLFDSLRNETTALLIVYSQKENKLLFVNNASKNLLGWSAEKFLADFSSIIQEGMHDWKKAIQTLSSAQESHARFLAKTKQGQEILLNCHLGLISSGLFRNYIIAVLYPA